MPAPELDLAYARSQFPGLADGWAFFDNAGGTQILSGVVERMNDFLFHRNVQTGGSYEVSQKAAASLQAGREAMQTFVNARRPEEIVFAPSTTVAMQNLVRSMASQFEPGDEVIVTVFDHESNIGPWTHLEARGVTLRVWNLDRDTLEPRLEDLAALMNERTKLVAVTWVSNILGAINPIAEIARFVHDRGARICVDAVAYAPHRAIDVQALDVDYLAFSLYKVFGPHYAMMYGRYERLEELDGLYHYFYGKDQVPKKLEPGNASYELAYSATGIVDYLAELGRRSGANGSLREQLEAAFEAITRHECLLGERLLRYLRSRPDCRVIGRTDGTDVMRAPTISFRIEGMNAGAVARAMDAHRIAIRFGDFHARRLIEYLDVADHEGVVRVSMTHYNSLDEVDALVTAFEQILP
ncbi:MAG: cysteine desulfurase-like protein [Pseudomonadales bacterium]|jgi:cysteine desulfurase family protein (TIGR01976 family)|nr:cysteine desulfurase-like protein [Pseudomonadales bacterium]